MQVADAVDDPRRDEWLKVTAGILIDGAIRHNRSGALDPPQGLLAGLGLLPDQLALLVIGAATGDDLAKELGILLDVLPRHLHAPLVAKIVPPDRELSVPPFNESLTFFAALAALPPDIPPLLSITVGAKSPQSARAAFCAPRSATAQQKAAGLAAALHRHSSITSLRLDTRSGSCDDGPCMSILAPGIAALTGLRALHLDNDYRLTPEGVLQLSGALHNMSRLQQLAFRIHAEPETATSSHKMQLRGRRPGDTQACARGRKVCLATALSAVTALTHLHIRATGECWRSNAAIPLKLPCLSHITIDSSRPAAAAAILSALSAPLSTLSLQGWFEWHEEDIALAQQLWGAVHSLQHLRAFSVSFQPHTERVAPAKAALLAHAPATLASLSSLQELSISGDLAELRDVMHALADSGVGIKRLQVSSGKERNEENRLPWASSGEWGDLLRHLARLTQMQHLAINIQSLDRMCCGVAALAPLTQLTALHIFAWWSGLDSAEDVLTLVNMRQLRSLGINGYRLSFDLHRILMFSLGILPLLEELALRPRDLDHGFDAEFVQSFVHWGGSWPSLRWVSFFTRTRNDALWALFAASHFPALEEMMLCEIEADEGLDLQPDDPRYPGSLREVLDEEAARKGFRITLGYEWTRLRWKSKWMPAAGACTVSPYCQWSIQMSVPRCCFQ